MKGMMYDTMSPCSTHTTPESLCSQSIGQKHPPDSETSNAHLIGLLQWQAKL